jgi:hypothetical protein
LAGNKQVGIPGFGNEAVRARDKWHKNEKYEQIGRLVSCAEPIIDTSVFVLYRISFIFGIPLHRDNPLSYIFYPDQQDRLN